MSNMMRLVEPLIPALRRYARALLRNPSDADDLVQDCLERAVGRWHQRRLDGDARTWLYAIVHNLAVSQMRQRARRGAARSCPSRTSRRQAYRSRRVRTMACATAI